MLTGRWILPHPRSPRDWNINLSWGYTEKAWLLVDNKWCFIFKGTTWEGGVDPAVASQTPLRLESTDGCDWFGEEICCLGIGGWSWGIVTGKVMGNRVCALGPQPGEAPSPFSCWGENKSSLRKGWKTDQSSPLCYKMTQRHIRQNRSGKASLGPCQLKARRWGSVSVSSAWQWLRLEGLEVEGAERRGEVKGKQQSNNFASGLRSLNANLLPSPPTR